MRYQAKHSTLVMMCMHPGYADKSEEESEDVPLDRQEHREQGNWYEDEKGE